MNRRQFLKTVGIGAVAAGPLAYVVTKMQAGAFAPTSRGMEGHAIERLTFGVTPDLYGHVHQIGAGAFISEQLNPNTIDDPRIDYYLGPFNTTLSQNAGVLINQKIAGGTVSNALYGSTVVRALQSNRQLHERMVHFFSNHFHVFIGKGNVLYFKVDDDRDVIRPYAMTTFRQILGASAHSPAMMNYLDNASSTKDRPNENYAREMMELHTLSVNGGYSETDVKEVARCFTGWTVARPKDSTDGRLEFQFRPERHDNAAKTVLGTMIPAGGGEQDGETVLDLVAKHPATAKFVSTKIARRFIGDDPPAALVERLSGTFQQSSGDLTAILRNLFTTQEFWNAPPKFKLPLEYMISIFRALNIEMSSNPNFLVITGNWLRQTGNFPFSWPAPNGYPDLEEAWLGALFERWNIALTITSGGIPGTAPDFESLLNLIQANQVSMRLEDMLGFMGNYLLGRAMTDDEHAIVTEFAHSVASDLQTQFLMGTTLLLASPAFQYR
jgi:uncharacterized protein (DUF1800 family)